MGAALQRGEGLPGGGSRVAEGGRTQRCSQDDRFRVTPQIWQRAPPTIKLMRTPYSHTTLPGHGPTPKHSTARTLFEVGQGSLRAA